EDVLPLRLSIEQSRRIGHVPREPNNIGSHELLNAMSHFLTKSFRLHCGTKTEHVHGELSQIELGRLLRSPKQLLEEQIQSPGGGTELPIPRQVESQRTAGRTSKLEENGIPRESPRAVG